MCKLGILSSVEAEDLSVVARFIYSFSLIHPDKENIV